MSRLRYFQDEEHKVEEPEEEDDEEDEEEVSAKLKWSAFSQKSRAVSRSLD